MNLWFSRENWQEEITKHTDLPDEIKGLLIELINAHFKKLISPTATNRLIELAKNHLSDIIQIDQDLCWRVAVFIPDNPAGYRSFFLLVPAYHGGELKELSEL